VPHNTTPRWVPASTRCAGANPGLTCAPQAVTASPAALATFTAAFTSRSSHAPHSPHCQVRICSGLGPSLAPQAEQTCEVGSNLPIRWNLRPYRWALYSSILTNADHPASCTDLAMRVRASALTARSSTAIAWFSRLTLARGWAEAIAVPKLHIDIIFGFMFNIRDIAAATYRVVLSSASSALPKDRHRMFTVPGLN
jgi:hypothetical protein